jgi:hypothetical protein
MDKKSATFANMNNTLLLPHLQKKFMHIRRKGEEIQNDHIAISHL